MKYSTKKTGMSVLIFVVLLSTLLLICLGAWKSTVYLVDFTFQKQIYMQNRYHVEGIMRWSVTWIISEWDQLKKILQHSLCLTYPLPDWPNDIARFKETVPILSIQYETPDTWFIQVSIQHGATCRCKLNRRMVNNNNTSEYFFYVHDWHLD